MLRLLTSIGWLAILAPLAAQPKPWTPPKTPWGDPDLQGVWPGTEMVGTPLQRDPSLGTRAVLSDQEFAQRVERAKRQADVDSQETVNETTRCDPTRRLPARTASASVLRSTGTIGASPTARLRWWWILPMAGFLL
jgi:hypothetical protein